MSQKTRTFPTAPKILSFSENPAPTRNFLKNFRNYIEEFLRHPEMTGLHELKKYSLTFLNSLRFTKEIDLPTALFMDAEFSRWAIFLHDHQTLLTRQLFFSSVEKTAEYFSVFWSPLVKAGSTLRAEILEKTIKRSFEVKGMPIGLSMGFKDEKEENIQSSVENILNHFEKILGTQTFVKVNFLAPALIEAMMNILEHGYIYKQSNKYWRFGVEISPDCKMLEAVVVDLGQSMCLPHHTQASDATIIENLMTYRTSRHAEMNRGRGSQDIQDPCQNHPKNTVTIYSRRGVVTYSRDGVLERQDHACPIMGTVIHWKLHLVDETVPEETVVEKDGDS